jgi:hypothetical protein
LNDLTLTNMAVLAAILPVVSRSSSLSLELYQFAALSPKEAKDSLEVARAINNFASILKQVGTIIKEDDRLPSYEVRSFPYASYAITAAIEAVDQAVKYQTLQYEGRRKTSPVAQNNRPEMGYRPNDCPNVLRIGTDQANRLSMYSKT